MSEFLKGKFKCSFGTDVCESMNLYVPCCTDKDILEKIFDYRQCIIIFTEKPIKFLENKLEIYSSKYNDNSKNDVHISVPKSEVVFEDLDIRDEDGFHLYNVKNVQVSSKEEGNLITYKLKADWIKGFCNPKCKYWKQVENSLQSIF